MPSQDLAHERLHLVLLVEEAPGRVGDRLCVVGNLEDGDGLHGQGDPLTRHTVLFELGLVEVEGQDACPRLPRSNEGTVPGDDSEIAPPSVPPFAPEITSASFGAGIGRRTFLLLSRKRGCLATRDEDGTGSRLFHYDCSAVLRKNLVSLGVGGEGFEPPRILKMISPGPSAGIGTDTRPTIAMVSSSVIAPRYPPFTRHHGGRELPSDGPGSSGHHPTLVSLDLPGPAVPRLRRRRRKYELHRSGRGRRLLEAGR